MRRFGILRTACPNFLCAAHVLVVAISMSAPKPSPEAARHLKPDEVRAELAHIKPGVRSPLRDAIVRHAARSGQEVAELLNEAVKRALSSRAIQADVPFGAVA